jgi:excisionase family DNA binding protein
MPRAHDRIGNLGPESRPESATRLRNHRFYTVPETAEILRISAPTIYREIREGRFPAIRIRGRYVVPAKAVDAMEDAALGGSAVDASQFVIDFVPGA